MAWHIDFQRRIRKDKARNTRTVCNDKDWSFESTQFSDPTMAGLDEEATQSI